MTVKTTISNLLILNLEDRLQKLQSIGAPEIVIKGTQQQLDNIKAGNLKVERMARKYKIANEEVKELYQADAKAYDWKGQVNKTVVLKMVTESGTYYYDYFSNSIGQTCELSICGGVESLDYQEVRR